MLLKNLIFTKLNVINITKEKKLSSNESFFLLICVFLVLAGLISRFFCC